MDSSDILVKMTLTFEDNRGNVYKKFYCAPVTDCLTEKPAVASVLEDRTAQKGRKCRDTMRHNFKPWGDGCNQKEGAASGTKEIYYDIKEENGKGDGKKEHKANIKENFSSKGKKDSRDIKNSQMNKSVKDTIKYKDFKSLFDRSNYEICADKNFGKKESRIPKLNWKVHNAELSLKNVKDDKNIPTKKITLQNSVKSDINRKDRASKKLMESKFKMQNELNINRKCGKTEVITLKNNDEFGINSQHKIEENPEKLKESSSSTDSFKSSLYDSFKDYSGCVLNEIPLTQYKIGDNYEYDAWHIIHHPSFENCSFLYSGQDVSLPKPKKDKEPLRGKNVQKNKQLKNSQFKKTFFLKAGDQLIL